MNIQVKILHLMRAMVLLGCLNLAACVTVGPDYTPPVMDVPTGWNRLESSAVSSSGLIAKEPADLSRWWKSLKDPLLSDLVAAALQNNPDVRSALASLREARARRSVAKADLFPTVTGSGTATKSKSSEETGTGSTRELYSAGFDASWELDVFGGIRRSVEASEADFEASLANLYNTQVSLAAEVVANYIEVRSLQIRLDIGRKNLTSQSETLQLTEWRSQAGLVSRQDVEQARSNREQTRAQISSLEISLAEAEHRLDILLGNIPGTLHQRLAASQELPAVPQEIAVGIPAETLRQRPDIMASERKLAAETARVGVAEAARYPTFKLSGSIGLDALTLSGLDSSGASSYSLLGGVTAPIFNAGRLRSEVEIQDAVREQAQFTYEQTVLTALQEVENSLVALQRSYERIEALSCAVASAKSAAEMARQQYAAGLIDFQSVLDTERSILSIEDDLATSRADRVLAFVSLYKAMGGGWSLEDNSSTADRNTL